jgi:large subunit ribosomal protein L10
MAITKEKKQTILAKLDQIKQDSASIVFVKFSELPGNDTVTMRAKLTEEGVGYYVAKKTLIKRSFADAFEGEIPALDGEIAVAYSTDAIAPAQHIKTFMGQYKDKVAIVGGVFQGVYKDEAAMIEIASIPPLPVLRGMFVNVINSPIQGLAVALNAIAEKKA